MQTLMVLRQTEKESAGLLSLPHIVIITKVAFMSVDTIRAVLRGWIDRVKHIVATLPFFP